MIDHNILLIFWLLPNGGRIWLLILTLYYNTYVATSQKRNLSNTICTRLDMTQCL